MKYLTLIACAALLASCGQPGNQQADNVLAKEKKLTDSLSTLLGDPKLEWRPGRKDADLMSERMLLYTNEITKINDTAKVKLNEEQLKANLEFIKSIRSYQDMVDLSKK